MTKLNIARENQAAVDTGNIGPLCQYIDARLKRTSRHPVQFTGDELARIFRQSTLSELIVERLIANYSNYHVEREHLPIDARNLNCKGDADQRAVIIVTKLTFWRKAEIIIGSVRLPK